MNLGHGVPVRNSKLWIRLKWPIKDSFPIFNSHMIAKHGKYSIKRFTVFFKFEY